MTPVISPTSNIAHFETATDQERLQQAAQAFEAIFVRNMIGAMRSASLGDDLLGNSATDQFRTMMDDEVADHIAGQKGFGIADILVAQWKDKI